MDVSDQRKTTLIDYIDGLSVFVCNKLESVLLVCYNTPTDMCGCKSLTVLLGLFDIFHINKNVGWLSVTEYKQ